MAKNEKSDKSDAFNDLSFEEALNRLENIVTEMEEEELPLEKMIERFEEGTKLVKICQKRLSEAELKIQELEKKIGGDFSLKPMSLSNASENNVDEDKKENDE
ncbi:MAG: exodeoxyribonuclease VII small subunit [Verrucomicrobiia bacterium]|jgi:exodeoxyribonuclease VII small subunit